MCNRGFNRCCGLLEDNVEVESDLLGTGNSCRCFFKGFECGVRAATNNNNGCRCGFGNLF